MNSIKLVWGDEKINNSENTEYQKFMKSEINETFFFEKKDDYKKQQFNEEQLIHILGPSFAYDILKETQRKTILFCMNQEIHQDLFLNHQQIICLTNSWKDLKLLIQQEKQYIQTIRQLKQQFSCIPFVKEQYSHTSEAQSFYYLQFNEKLKQQLNIDEESLTNQIQRFIGKEDYDKMVELYKKKRKEQESQNGLWKKLFGQNQWTLFHILIFYYTTNQLYEKLNLELAKCEYSRITQIIRVLFDGFKKYSISRKITVYRGISFYKKEDFDQVLQNLQSWELIYWNTLVSTSKSREQGLKFAKQKTYGILFEIILDQKNPHPYIEDFVSQFQQEQEVLLFPQFNFKVIKQSKLKVNQKEIPFFTIKQHSDDLAVALDDKKRNNFWENKINQEFKQKSKIFSNQLVQRVKCFRRFLQNRNINEIQNIIKKEVQYNINEISQILLILSDQKYEQQICQMKETALNRLLNQNFNNNLIMNYDKMIATMQEQFQCQFIKIIKDIASLNDFKKQINNHFENYLIPNIPLIHNLTNNNNILINSAYQNQEVDNLSIVTNNKKGYSAYQLILKNGKQLLLKFKDGVLKCKDYPQNKYSQVNDNISNKANGLTVNEVIKDEQSKGPNEQFDGKLKRYSDMQIKQLRSHAALAIGVIVADQCLNRFGIKRLLVNAAVMGGLLLVELLSSKLSQLFQYLLGIWQIKNICDDKSLTKWESLTKIVQILFQMGLCWLILEIGLRLIAYYAFPYPLIFEVVCSFLGGYKRIGYNPEIKIEKSRQLANNYIIMAFSEDKLFWLYVKKNQDKLDISENDESLQENYPYFAPILGIHTEVTFRVFGVIEDNIDPITIWEDLTNERIKPICQGEQIIKIK